MTLGSRLPCSKAWRVSGERGEGWAGRKKQLALSLSRVGWLVSGGGGSILESRLLPDLALIISRGFCFKAGFGQPVSEGLPSPSSSSW